MGQQIANTKLYNTVTYMKLSVHKSCIILLTLNYREGDAFSSMLWKQNLRLEG